MIKHTSSGAVLANDVLMHAAVDALPFGGVGNSGMGDVSGRLARLDPQVLTTASIASTSSPTRNQSCSKTND